MIYTADDITSTLHNADTVGDIDWMHLSDIAHQVYHPSCFERYSKLDKQTNQPLCAIIDDKKHLVRKVYVDGWCVWGVTTMWMEDPAASKQLPLWAKFQFGTFPDL
jgi:hypothetical protein